MTRPACLNEFSRRSRVVCHSNGKELRLQLPTIKNQKSKIKNDLASVVAVSCVVLGPMAACGQTNIIEDFEGYPVGSLQYLDPTTVNDSGWSRDGVGAADWDVHCCSGSLTVDEDDTFDGSDKFLVLRRAESSSAISGLPSRSDENTDFVFPVLVEGSIRFQLNPGNNTWDEFRMALHDSASGKKALMIVYSGNFAHNGAASTGDLSDFYVRDGAGNLLASDIQPGALFDPAAYDRWYEIVITFNPGATFDLEISDIGPTLPVSLTSDVVARGVLTNLTGVSSGVLGVDTLRLQIFAGLGEPEQPTMIDNLIITRNPGAPVAGAETGTGMELQFPSTAFSIYQPEVTEDLTSGGWSAHGPQIMGDGGPFRSWARPWARRTGLTGSWCIRLFVVLVLEPCSRLEPSCVFRARGRARVRLRL